MLKKLKSNLAAQIFIALVLAIIVGLLFGKNPDFANNYIKPIGTIFLNLLKFIVCPIVLFSILCGMISMKDIRKVGSIGLKTIVYYMLTTAFAIVIGLLIVTTVLRIVGAVFAIVGGIVSLLVRFAAPVMVVLLLIWFIKGLKR